MTRKIIKIDSDACVGCGLCANACQQGAIQMEGGKAKLMREDHCDGLGNCLPVCPVGAITFEEREAPAFSKEHAPGPEKAPETLACGCPGTYSRALNRDAKSVHAPAHTPHTEAQSELNQWPVQIKLVPVNAPYFTGAHLLVAADCTAFAHGAFHEKYMRGKITVIGCPKLNDGDYSEKLTAILSESDIKSVTVARMEVPCCGGLERAVITALKNCGKMIPWQVVTISTEGTVLN